MSVRVLAVRGRPHASHGARVPSRCTRVWGLVCSSLRASPAAEVSRALLDSVDAARCVMIALVHDIGEAVIGDIVPSG